MNCSESKTSINQAGMSELDLYRKRYRHCRRLIDNDPRFKEMSKEEKDTYAQSLATPEYLDLTCDWAFKYLFQNHPDMLIMLLNDILRENITSIEFRNTELARMPSMTREYSLTFSARPLPEPSLSRCRRPHDPTNGTGCSFMGPD